MRRWRKCRESAPRVFRRLIPATHPFKIIGEPRIKWEPLHCMHQLRAGGKAREIGGNLPGDGLIVLRKYKAFALLLHPREDVPQMPGSLGGGDACFHT